MHLPNNIHSPDDPRSSRPPESNLLRGGIGVRIPGELATLEFVCPSCRRLLNHGQDTWWCRPEALEFMKETGIPDFVLPHRRMNVETFLTNYLRVRNNEQWGDLCPQYYLDLPFDDRSGKHPDIWRTRSRTFTCFLDHLLRHYPSGHARVLDVGAGNCWLSLKLAHHGFQVFAVDINVDPFDGLRVLDRIDPGGRSGIIPVRAEFDALPFGPSSFDVLVFGASLHYSIDVRDTLERALVILRPGGILYVLDSPLYRDMRNGEMMVRERRDKFRRDFDVDLPDELSGSFLIEDFFLNFGKYCRIEYLRPRYGVAWALRPLLATILRRRDPAVFKIIAMHKS